MSPHFPTHKEEDTHDPTIPRFYPIGTPGKPWTSVEDELWKTTIPKWQRSYQEEVVHKMKQLQDTNDIFDKELVLEQYGTTGEYPLYVLRTNQHLR